MEEIRDYAQRLIWTTSAIVVVCAVMVMVAFWTAAWLDLSHAVREVKTIEEAQSERDERIIQNQETIMEALRVLDQRAKRERQPRWEQN